MFMEVITMENTIIALEIMGKGMTGIFVATLLITGIVCLLGTFTSKTKK